MASKVKNEVRTIVPAIKAAVKEGKTSSEFAKYWSEQTGIAESSVGASVADARRILRNLTATWENANGERLRGDEVRNRLKLKQAEVKTMDRELAGWEIVEPGRELGQFAGGGQGRKVKPVDVDELLAEIDD